MFGANQFIKQHWLNKSYLYQMGKTAISCLLTKCQKNKEVYGFAKEAWKKLTNVAEGTNANVKRRSNQAVYCEAGCHRQPRLVTQQSVSFFLFSYMKPSRPACATFLQGALPLCNPITRQPIELESCSRHPRILGSLLAYINNFFLFWVWSSLWVTS